MRKWKHTLALCFLASIGIASTGCVKQSILAFDDHPKYPVTTLEVFRSEELLRLQTAGASLLHLY